MTVRRRWAMAVACLLLFALVVTVAPASAAPIVVTDDAGRTLKLDQPARRIVTLAPNLTEFVFALQSGGRVVGTVSSSDHPAAARDIVRVGDHQRIDVERVLQLKPDLVLAWWHGNPAREWEPLVQAGVPVFLMEPRRLDDVPGAWTRLGELLGQQTLAQQQRTAFETQRESLRRAQSGKHQPGVFYQVWREPLMSLNDQHMVSDVIRLCGGRNVFGDLQPLVPRLGIEEVIAAQPDVIMAAGPDVGDDLDRAHWQRGLEHGELRHWSRYRSLPAARFGQLYLVAGDLLTRQGPRVLDGARALCDVLDQVRAGRPSSSSPSP